MKKLNYIKLFENFQSEVEPRLKNALKIIVSTYKNECLGGAEHISEEFGEGDILKEYTKLTSDDKIQSILNNMANCCSDEFEGSAEHLCDWIDDDDCDYIADFIGLERLDYESDWTEQEEEDWCEID